MSLASPRTASTAALVPVLVVAALPPAHDRATAQPVQEKDKAEPREEKEQPKKKAQGLPPKPDRTMPPRSKAIGHAQDLGGLETGKLADLLVLPKAPSRTSTKPIRSTAR